MENTLAIVPLLNKIDELLWGNFLVVLLVGLGLFFTLRLRGMQFRYLAYSLKLAFTRRDERAEGDISQFQALMTALAATIGIGSIAGVATAIAAGGFGAVFWMWVIALVGMVTKFAEAILAVKYREVDENGQMRGGPMYYIAKGLGWKWLGGIVCRLLHAFSFCRGKYHSIEFHCCSGAGPDASAACLDRNHFSGGDCNRPSRRDQEHW